MSQCPWKAESGGMLESGPDRLSLMRNVVPRKKLDLAPTCWDGRNRWATQGHGQRWRKRLLQPSQVDKQSAYVP
jgi:hypothetical protein